MRIVKDTKERKNEILDVAEQLFLSNGFDNTSTNDILKEIHIARGTLYYHFKSKEDILNAVIERLINQLIKKAKEICNQKDIPALERFIKVIFSLNISDGQLGNVILEEVHKPQNALMHQKMQKSVLLGIVPLMTSLIEEMIISKEYFIDYPQEVVEMALIYYNTMFDDLMELDEENKKKKFIAFISNLECLLQIKPGSMYDLILKLKR